jgi:CheY-like chemotaxis protein
MNWVTGQINVVFIDLSSRSIGKINLSFVNCQILEFPTFQQPFMTTILLVEDEVLLREGVQETLEAFGYTVIGAGDGVEALDWLEQTPVSLIITDLVMPKMNGVAFIEQVRIKFPSLPIIVASGSPDSVTSRLGIDTIHVPGATACINKPFKSKDLINLVEKVITGVSP